jgi:hypothetical protein
VASKSDAAVEKLCGGTNEDASQADRYSHWFHRYALLQGTRVRIADLQHG